MSHAEGGPLAGYNSLMDPHLSGFYTNSRMRKHLIKSGLITNGGHIVSENTYRLNMARKEHKKHVRDMLAQAIVHKTLDMERGRQVAIKKKLEEIAKIELVRRVKTDRARKGDEDILPFLEPSKRKSRSQSRRSSEASSTGRRPKSAPSRSQRKRSRSSDNRSRNGRNSIDSGSQRSRPWSASSNGSTNRSKSGRNSRAQSAKYPRGEVDDKHLYSLNQQALQEYTMGEYNMDSNRGPSPYTYSQLPPEMVPSPPPAGTPRSGHRRGRQGKGGRGRQESPENKQSKKSARSSQDRGSLMLHRSEPAMKHQERVQTMCDVSMHYFGKSIRLDYERFDPRDEVTIEQQHCGGNTLIVFRERIIPGSDFTFTSRRHRGYPFSLTFYVNGLQYCRLSTCCEYKHPSGSRLGGTQGYFSVVSIEGASPCYRCQARDSEPRKKKKAAKRKSSKDQDEREEDNDEVEVDDDDSEQEAGDRTMENDPGVKVVVEDEEESGESESETESMDSLPGKSGIPPTIDELSETASEPGYEDDFTDGSEKTSSRSTSRSSSHNSSRSSSRNSSRNSSPHSTTSSSSAKSDKNTYSEKDWSVKVYSSDVDKAGTDANVTMVLFSKDKNGKMAESDQVKLDNSGNNFERGKCDEFKVEIPNVGTPYKLRVEQDGTGACPGWRLDRVELENLSSRKKYMFVCNRWLAEDKDDGATVREIPAEGDDIKDTAKSVKYNVSVYTSNKPNAGTDANVFVNLFGKGGSSGNRQLKKSQNKNKFEKGKMDVFTIEGVGLKEIKKIRVGHDGQGAGDGWFLDKIVVKPNDGSQGQLVYRCNRWLDVQEDDGQIVRDLAIGSPMTEYLVSVHTGDKKGAGTDANVSITVCGENGDTGEIPLSKSRNNRNKFEKGKVDEFILDADPLGKLEKVRIGHDGDRRGAGWYLAKVVVKPKDGSASETTFPCDRWLDVAEDDGEIVRELYAEGTRRPPKDGMVPWYIKVYTSDKSGAGTDANVSMVLYGKNKDGDTVESDEISLDNRGNNFEQGACDNFEEDLVDIGTPYKLKICQDGSGRSSAWHLDRVEMENLSTNKKYMFVCNRWLAPDEDDGATIREIPAEGDDIEAEKSVRYAITVHTGDKQNAGTDANVFINLIGAGGESGQRKLTKSQSKNKFERGNVDEFTVEAVGLKAIDKIRVGHDGQSSGSGWFLKKVVVKPNDGQQQLCFNCGRWLDVDEDDGQIVRELSVSDDMTQYKVKVYTGSKWGAGTDANVSINIVGEDGETGNRQLTESNNTHKFEKGKVDEFSVDSERLGSLQKVVIGHDGAMAGDGWFLDKVVVTETNANPVEAICNRWLDVNEDDGEIERELYFQGVQAPSEHTGMVPWNIKVYTSDARGAGTDANITAVLFGRNKDGKTVTSDTINLDNKGDNFEKGACDTFDIETVNVGKPFKLRIAQDGTGGSPAWHLDRVEMENRSNNKKYMFVCNRWLADDEDDGATVREIPAEGDDIRRPETLVRYTVGVYTGSKWGAGTDASVVCTVVGDRGDTGERQLAMSQTHKNKFEKGNVDEFSIEAIDIGRPQLVRIGHDGSRSGEGWYLDKVVVRPNNESRGQVIFECNRWLDVNEDDGEVVRELSPSN